MTTHSINPILDNQFRKIIDSKLDGSISRSQHIIKKIDAYSCDWVTRSNNTPVLDRREMTTIEKSEMGKSEKKLQGQRVKNFFKVFTCGAAHFWDKKSNSEDLSLVQHAGYGFAIGACSLLTLGLWVPSLLSALVIYGITNPTYQEVLADAENNLVDAEIKKRALTAMDELHEDLKASPKAYGDKGAGLYHAAFIKAKDDPNVDVTLNNEELKKIKTHLEQFLTTVKQKHPELTSTAQYRNLQKHIDLLNNRISARAKFEKNTKKVQVDNDLGRESDRLLTFKNLDLLDHSQLNSDDPTREESGMNPTDTPKIDANDDGDTGNIEYL